MNYQATHRGATQSETLRRRATAFAAIATLLSPVALGASACSSPAPAATPVPVPPFQDTTGEGSSVIAYPAGPYGIGVGSIIANYAFEGFPDPSKSMTPVQVRLSDFYNPHAFDASYHPASADVDDRLFPATSGYALAGKAKPTVLLVDLASVWCVPCNQEAKGVLPQKHAEYVGCGGEFLLDLHDGATPGTSATFTNLTTWTKNYKVDYPSIIDPAFKLDVLFAASAFPTNVIIDTTTMKIVETLAGEVVPTTCGDASACSTDADCQVCQGVCSDGSANCKTDADCTAGAGVTCGALSCGDGAACTTAADCATKTCSTSSFWTRFESHLDKTRPGCMVK